eukprot:TRINITY_DN6740_c0_g2_i1.p1 TRINITY_DN6740_c0_g2~~TRINITY_DN6740_c0_g2_i1.p1  ORF type:complete len:1204 (-),score=415.77 TRINITY_DN6740_c0_g2_i1:30-3641(-)
MWCLLQIKFQRWLQSPNDPRMKLVVLQSSCNDSFQFEWIKYEDVYRRCMSLIKAMEFLCGVKKGDMIGICANNFLEFFLYDYAATLMGLICVPIPANFEDKSLSFVLSDTQPILIICESIFVERFTQFKKENGLKVQTIIEMDEKNNLHPPLLQVGESLLNYKRSDKLNEEEIVFFKHSQVESLGRKLCQLHPEGVELNLDEWKQKAKLVAISNVLGSASLIDSKKKKKEGKNSPSSIQVESEEPKKFSEKDIYTIIFTSGSTGLPKGAVFSNGVWNKSTQTKSRSSFDPRVAVSFAPLFHSSGKRHVMTDLYQGGRVGIISRGMANIFDELELIGPSHMSSTPRLWNVLFHEFQNEMEEYSKQNKLQKTDEEYLSYQKKVLSQFGKKLGKRIWSIGSGGAPTSPEVLDFLRAAFKCHVHSGYGATETGSIHTTGKIEVSEVQYRIEDVPELNYFKTDRPYPRGEFVTKTKTMVEGYWNNKELNEQSFTPDGFFKTGDIVQLIGPHTIQIIDRKKAFFKLAQGEFVAPEKLEILFVNSKYVDQIFVTGDGLQSYIVAIVVPNFTNLCATLNKNCNEDEMSKLCESQEAKDLIFQDLVRIAQEEHLATYEIPLRLGLRKERFTIENGLLTSTQKVARNSARTFFKESIDQLYSKNEGHNIQENGYNSKLFSSIAGSILNCKLLKEGDNLISLGLDSLAAVSIRAKLKAKTGIDVPMSVLYGASDIKQITDYIENVPKNKENNSNSDAVTPDNWELEIKSLLDESKILPKIKERSSVHQFAAGVFPVFLTGATGFLGAFLLSEILKKNESGNIYCLSRVHNDVIGEKKVELAMQKIKSNLIRYSLWEDSFASRIKAVPGDLNSVRLGLSSEQFEEIGKEIRTIVHCGSWVNTLFDYQTLKPSNVLGTIEILKLATIANHLVYFHYISTMSAAFGLKDRIIDNPRPVCTDSEELRLAKQQRGYGISKWVAEKIVMEAQKAGLPAIVYQPGTIGGSSINGASNRLDYIMKVIGSFLETKCLPETPAVNTLKQQEYSINLTPADHLASWITQMIFITQNDLAIYKQTLASPQVLRLPMIHPLGNLRWKDVLKWIASFSEEDLQVLPYSHWHSTLDSSACQINASKVLASMEPFVPALSQHLPLTKVPHNLVSQMISQTLAVLKLCHIDTTKCKAIDKKLFHKYLKDILDHNKNSKLEEKLIKIQVSIA